MSKLIAASMLALMLELLLSIHSAVADDWPQWRGPKGDGNYNEPGLFAQLPDGGLPQVWRADCGYGYAGPVVAAGRVFLFEYVKTSGEITNLPSRRDELEGQERLRCFDVKTGNEIWSSEYDRSYSVSYPGGPRATPTVAGDYVVTLGVEGDLMCHRASDGQRLWHVNFRDKYGVETPIWGHSASPLVMGDRVVATVGGKDALAVAFDLKTGAEQWTALNADEPGYCGPTTLDYRGEKSLLIFYPLGVAALTPTTGAVEWTAEIRPKFGMSIATPVQSENRLFVSGYGESMMMTLGESPQQNSIDWRGKPNTSVYASNATPYFGAAENAIFGCDIETSELMGVDSNTGERLWETKAATLADPDARRPRHGTAFIVRHTASGKYLLFNESGELIAANMSRDGYDELWRDKLVEPTSDAFGRPVVWVHPAFAEGCVFARNDKEIVCNRIEE